MTNKTNLNKIEEKILELLEYEGRAMSIREIGMELEKKHGIKKSPQLIKRYLLILKKKGKIE